MRQARENHFFQRGRREKVKGKNLVLSGHTFVTLYANSGMSSVMYLSYRQVVTATNTVRYKRHYKNMWHGSVEVISERCMDVRATGTGISSHPLTMAVYNRC